ncbi:MAG: DUF1007 family protein [Tateyamaria sp.]|uniref:DUF1007 family protein n=2 Tax=Tateyamaria sp. TaxID=1929288 RepID=UPI00329ADC8D
MRGYILTMLNTLLRPGLLAFGLCVAPTLGAAHPHVFIETAVRAVVDEDGTFKGVEVTWTYDDFYSLLLFADMKLDSDADGSLRPDELAQLEGFDLNWVEGYEGDSYALRDGVPVALGEPQSRGVNVENGRIISSHFRAADAPASGVVIKIYDPTFYTAYEIVGQVEVDGPCTASVEPANLDEAYSYVEELLYATPASQAQDEFPEVGDRFADTVMLSCQS